MALLSAEALKKSRRTQVKNLLKKQADGGTLTAREERILLEAASDVPHIGGENFVRTYDELATRLQISRRGLNKVCQRFPDEFPVPRADGRHDVVAWLDFFRTRNIKGSAEDAQDDGRPISVTDWRARELELKCTKLELENAKVAGELVDAAEVETGTSAMVQAFNQGLNNLVPRLAGKILSITDYHEAETIIQAEVDVLKKALQRCDFLSSIEEPLETATKTLPDQRIRARAKSADDSTRPPGKARPSSVTKGQQPKRAACDSKDSRHKPKAKFKNSGDGRK